MKLITVIIVLLLVIVGIVMLSGSRAEEAGTLGSETFVETAADDEKNTDADNLPKFNLVAYSGSKTDSDSLVGKPLVINSWATWCPFCVDELPDFAQIQEEFLGEVTFVAINRNESLDTSKDFTDSLGISDKLLFLLDPEDSFYRAIGGIGMPETLFVNSDGTIHFHKRGPMSLEDARGRTAELISLNQ